MVTHRQSSIDQTIPLILEEIDRFVDDSDLNHCLLGEPVLRVLRRFEAEGVVLADGLDLKRLIT